MNKNEAMQHALGYAAGREDASKTATAEPGETPGFMAFATAYATAWDRYNREIVCFMVNCRGAYDAWQASEGQSIYRLAELTGHVLNELAQDGDAVAMAELAARSVTS